VRPEKGRMHGRDGKADLFHECQQLLKGEHLLVAKGEGRVQGPQQAGICAAAQAIRPFTDPVKKRIPAGCVEKQPAPRFDDVIGVLQGFCGKIDMLEHIPEGDDIEKTGESLLPVSGIDGLPVQRKAEFPLGELPEDRLRFDALDNSPRFDEEMGKQSASDANIAKRAALLTERLRMIKNAKKPATEP